MQSEISPAAAPRRWLDRDALRQTFARAVVFRSLSVAATIGTILNAINQGPELIAGRQVNLVKILLTYTVPFCVASFGAYAAFRTRRQHPCRDDDRSRPATRLPPRTGWD